MPTPPQVSSPAVAPQAPVVAGPGPAPAPPPVPGAATQGQSLGVLRDYEQTLVSQLTSLNVERQILVRQLRGARSQIRAAAAPRLAEIEIQSAHLQVELATTRAQIAARQGGRPVGRPGAETNPPFRTRGPVLDGDQITGIIIVFMLVVMMPISLGLLRRLWRRTPKETASPLVDSISPRLERLEHAVDAIAVEVERISEGQRFVTRVLAERPMSAPAPAPAPAAIRERAGDAGSAGAVGEAKPYLALGAGPIEPIRMAERQAVRSFITPH